MEETTWRERAAAVWRWARRMVNGVPSGGRIRFVDLENGAPTSGRPAVSVVLGQWPGRRVGDAVVSDRIRGAALRRMVAAAGGPGLSDPAWYVHGIEAVPRGAAAVARWLVGLAEASAGGPVVVDTAEMNEQTRDRLAAHLRRLAPREDIEITRGKKSA